MASLTDCPIELLNQIFRGLPQADLASLCKAQSTLRKAALPLLYENIHFRWTETNTPPIIQFLRSVLACPDLALHVRRLELLGMTFQKTTPYSAPKIPVDSDSISPLVSAIESLCLPYQSSWVEHLRAGTMDAFTALLIARVPKLRSLCMDGNFAREAGLFSNVLRSALCDHNGTGLPGFEHVHNVVSQSARGRTRAALFSNTESVLPLFYLPNLRKLEVVIDTPQSGVIEWPISPPRLSNLTSLELWWLRETSLEQVLRATPCLKSLTWHWVHKADKEELPWGRTVNLEMVASALGYVKDTLEDLIITSAVYIGVHEIEYDSMEVRGNLRSLSAFHLKTLEMPWPFFVGLSTDCGLKLGDVVPTSVEHLTLSEGLPMIAEFEWEYEEIIERLLEYLGGLQQSDARLRKLHLVANHDSFGWASHTRWRKRLADACSEHEVEFGVIQDY
ncbi:hypothetical protein LX32DRAFT_350941 [Colletotrichum zoysiae]|uniref:F-box domain-containing protein n=1 Tax=Colletotrichum zoysiae TaxID=1216348 RepID=A0AAD9M5G7_9PEZI|nr:hypothetical protein LX32DRAFT_350941 [Colletotrichum zoysiae]